ncbi:MAG: YARHG domain-containing protein [bacterium]
MIGINPASGAAGPPVRTIVPNTGVIYVRDGVLKYTASNFTPRRDLKIDLIHNTVTPFSTFPLDGEYLGRVEAGDLVADLRGAPPGKLRRDLTKRQLRILRNTYFALEGYQFNRKGLQNYFSKKCWYEPDPGVSASEIAREFNQATKDRIDTIKMVEDNYDNSVTWKDWLITYDSKSFTARDGDSVITDSDYYPEKTSQNCDVTLKKRQLLSIVGPYVSFRYTRQEYCGGASAWVKTNWVTIDLREDGQTIGLAEVFPPENIKKEFEENVIFRKAARNNWNYDCVNVKKSLKNNPGFAFFQNYKGQADVRVGLTEDTGGSCRGGSLKVGLKFPLEGDLRQWLNTAQNRQTIMYHLLP